MTDKIAPELQEDDKGPIWVPFDPDEIAEGDLGWVWFDDEWHIIGLAQSFGLSFARGFPYIPAHKPNVTPRECDALEVHVSLSGGGSYALAYGDKTQADAALRHLSELMAMGRNTRTEIAAADAASAPRIAELEAEIERWKITARNCEAENETLRSVIGTGAKFGIAGSG